MARLDEMIGWVPRLNRCSTLTPENIRERIGYLTGSRMKDVLDFRNDGQPGAKRLKYLRELVAERMTDSATNHHVTPAMEWGAAMEEEAKSVYAYHAKHELLPTEFMKHRTIEYFGGTPDALIGAYGGVEVKCPETTTFIAWKIAGVIPEEHLPQMESYMSITGRQWWDFCAYDPRVKVGANHFIRRLVRNEEKINQIEAVAVEFLSIVESVFRQVTEKES